MSMTIKLSAWETYMYPKLGYTLQNGIHSIHILGKYPKSCNLEL